MQRGLVSGNDANPTVHLSIDPTRVSCPDLRRGRVCRTSPIERNGCGRDEEAFKHEDLFSSFSFFTAAALLLSLQTSTVSSDHRLVAADLRLTGKRAGWPEDKQSKRGDDDDDDKKNERRIDVDLIWGLNGRAD